MTVERNEKAQALLEHNEAVEESARAFEAATAARGQLQAAVKQLDEIVRKPPIDVDAIERIVQLLPTAQVRSAQQQATDAEHRLALAAIQVRNFGLHV